MNDKQTKVIILCAVAGMIAVIMSVTAVLISAQAHNKAEQAYTQSLPEIKPPYVEAEKNLCRSTCEKVATNNQNFTEPHASVYHEEDGYCECVFQGPSRSFAFDVGLMLSTMMQNETEE